MPRSLFGAFLAMLVSSLLSAPAAGAQQKPLRLDLNIPALKLVVYEGDEVLRSYPVSVGMPGFDTPSGSFSISHAEWNPWWRPPTHRAWARDEKVTPPGPRNPMGRVKLFFEPLYFIHGTPESESIGTPASHGCVRMLNKDVIALAKLLHERAAPQVASREIDRILANSSATRRVNFQDSIPLVIRYDLITVESGAVRVYPDVYRRNAIHSENVYQALLAAGYDPNRVSHDSVRRLVERARGVKEPLTIDLAEAFGEEFAAASRAETALR